MTVGYLGNPAPTQTPRTTIPWCGRHERAEPQLLGSESPNDTYGELVDVNDRGQAAGMSGTFTKNGFPLVEPAIWQTGQTGLRTLRVPAAARAHPVVSTQLNDINARGAIIGDVYGLAGEAFSKLRRVYPSSGRARSEGEGFALSTSDRGVAPGWQSDGSEKQCKTVIQPPMREWWSSAGSSFIPGPASRSVVVPAWYRLLCQIRPCGAGRGTWETTGTRSDASPIALLRLGAGRSQVQILSPR